MGEERLRCPRLSERDLCRLSRGLPDLLRLRRWARGERRRPLGDRDLLRRVSCRRSRLPDRDLRSRPKRRDSELTLRQAGG